jgi:NodT family efflux transporter outer membrane factor (OMF) lipoprotein
MKRDKKVLLRSAVLLAAASAGGCIHLKDAPRAQTEAKVPFPPTWAKLNPENAGTVGDNWVTSFDDPVLDALVAEALANNRDLQVAAARRDEAAALARRAGANFWPTVDLSAAALAGAGNAGLIGPFPQGGIVQGLVNWELDVWGRIRYQTRAAEADAVSTEADLEFARQSIAAQVASTYYLAVSNRLRLRNSQDEVVVQQEIDRIQQVKTREGQSSRLESELSRADLHRFRSDEVNRQAALEEALRALEVLLGRYPAAEVETAAAAASPVLPPVPGAVPAGLPAELLERRPDIIAAEQLVYAAFFRTESAKTTLLPRIALTASGGYASKELNGLFNIHAGAISAGANLTQPLFDAGARFADIDAARAAQRQAVARYASIVLNAFREVQNGLANDIYFRELSAQLQLSSASLDVALPLAEQRYRSGEISLLNFKQVQTQAYDTKDAAIAARLSEIQQRIDLHRALGGSIEGRGGAVVPAVQPSTRPTTGPSTLPVSGAADVPRK